MKASKITALLIVAALLLAFAGCTVQIEITDPSALAMLTTVSAVTENADPEGVQVSGGWYYTVSGGNATIVSTSDAVKTSEIRRTGRLSRHRHRRERHRRHNERLRLGAHPRRGRVHLRRRVL